MVPFGFSVTVPFGASAEVTVRGWPVGSVSLARTGMVTGVSSAVVAVSGLASGSPPPLSTVSDSWNMLTEPWKCWSTLFKRFGLEVA